MIVYWVTLADGVIYGHQLHARIASVVGELRVLITRDAMCREQM